MQEQLSQIFEVEQIAKRVESCNCYIDVEIMKLCELPHIEKLLVLDMVYLADEQLILRISLQEKFMQVYSPHINDPMQLRVVLDRMYPQHPPRLYFESDNINECYTVPGRDYFATIVPKWSDKFTLNELIPQLVSFFRTIIKIDQPFRLGNYVRGDFMDYNTFVSRQSSELYSIMIMLEDQTTVERYMVLNRYDILLFEACELHNYMRLVDVYSLKSVSMVMSHKQYKQGRMLLSIKLGEFEGICQIASEQCEIITKSIIQKKLKLPNYDRQQQTTTLVEKYPVTLIQINKQIMIKQNSLMKQYSQEIVNSLIELCNQAIEFCSLVSCEPYDLYLDRLQRLMSIQGSHVGRLPSVFQGFKEPQKQTYHDKLHDLSQVTCASSDLFDLA